MKKVLLSALILGTFTISAQAACFASSCVDVQVEKLYMTAGGTLYVATDGDEKALNCAAGAGNGGVSNKYMSLVEGDIGKNAMYSLLLTAKTTGKAVSIKIQEGTADCRVSYITIN